MAELQVIARHTMSAGDFARIVLGRLVPSGDR
jgi:hypothetical protein